jgi:diguanylate cyclase (GGDEF)-like protein
MCRNPRYVSLRTAPRTNGGYQVTFAWTMLADMGSALDVTLVERVKAAGRYLLGDEQERAWLSEAAVPIDHAVQRASLILALILFGSAPWAGLGYAVLIGLTVLMGSIGDVVLKRWKGPGTMALLGCFAQTLIAGAIATSGHVADGYLVILVATAGPAVIALPDRLSALSVGYTSLLMIAVAIWAGGDAMVRLPPMLLIPLGVLFVVAIIASSVRRSSINYRDSAVIDPLTGMLNRLALRTRTKELALLSALTGQPVALIALDIDHFKAINDRLGHAAGDRVLAGLAYRIRKCLRAYDLTYRLGGEEFLVLVPGGSADDAFDLAERLREAIRDEPIADVAISVSIGVATSEPGAPFVFEETFKRADAALYEAKEAGRDCVRPLHAASPRHDLLAAPG